MNAFQVSVWQAAAAPPVYKNHPPLDIFNRVANPSSVSSETPYLVVEEASRSTEDNGGTMESPSDARQAADRAARDPLDAQEDTFMKKKTAVHGTIDGNANYEFAKKVAAVASGTVDGNATDECAKTMTATKSGTIDGNANYEFPKKMVAAKLCTIDAYNEFAKMAAAKSGPIDSNANDEFAKKMAVAASSIIDGNGNDEFVKKIGAAKCGTTDGYVNDEFAKVATAKSCPIDGNEFAKKMAVAVSGIIDGNGNDEFAKKIGFAKSSTIDGNANDECAKTAIAISDTIDTCSNDGCVKKKAVPMLDTVHHDDANANMANERSTRNPSVLRQDEELVRAEGGVGSDTGISLHNHYHYHAAPDVADKYSLLNEAAAHARTLGPPPIEHWKIVKVALDLNIRRCDGKDWRALLHHFHLGAVEGTLANSTEPGLEVMRLILGNGREAIIEALHSIGRADLAHILKSDESRTASSSVA